MHLPKELEKYRYLVDSVVSELEEFLESVGADYDICIGTVKLVDGKVIPSIEVKVSTDPIVTWGEFYRYYYKKHGDVKFLRYIDLYFEGGA